jgi:hypothetical protein
VLIDQLDNHALLHATMDDDTSRSKPKRAFLKRGEGIQSRLTAYQRPYRKVEQHAAATAAPAGRDQAASMHAHASDRPSRPAQPQRPPRFSSGSPVEELLGETLLVGLSGGAQGATSEGAGAWHAAGAAPVASPRPQRLRCSLPRPQRLRAMPPRTRAAATGQVAHAQARASRGMHAALQVVTRATTAA